MTAHKKSEPESGRLGRFFCFDLLLNGSAGTIAFVVLSLPT
nr:hypothetical protein RP007_03567 [Rhizobium sp. P007]